MRERSTITCGEGARQCLWPGTGGAPTHSCGGSAAGASYFVIGPVPDMVPRPEVATVVERSLDVVSTALSVPWAARAWRCRGRTGWVRGQWKLS